MHGRYLLTTHGRYLLTMHGLYVVNLYGQYCMYQMYAPVSILHAYD